jgi:hypothetical protein
MSKKQQTVELTKEIIESARSSYGGFSLMQMRCLGVVGFPKGWLKECTNKIYPKKVVDKFVALKDKHLYENQKADLFID